MPNHYLLRKHWKQGLRSAFLSLVNCLFLSLFLFLTFFTNSVWRKGSGSKADLPFLWNLCVCRLWACLSHFYHNLYIHTQLYTSYCCYESKQAWRHTGLKSFLHITGQRCKNSQNTNQHLLLQSSSITSLCLLHKCKCAFGVNA